MRDMARTSRQENGFTMAELLIAIAIGSIVMALIATAFWTQSQTSKNQKMTLEMQQNIRAALYFLQRDIMMAGFSDDPSNPSAGTFTFANPTSMQFTFAEPMYEEDNIDNNNDGTVDEEEEKDGIDNDGDGTIDETNELETIDFSLNGTQLWRDLLEADNGFASRLGVPPDVIADNIQNVEFLYILEDGTTATSVAGADSLAMIRKVGISLLAQTGFDVSGYTDTQVFTTLSGANWGPFNDHRGREMVTTTVLCRNMIR